MHGCSGINAGLMGQGFEADVVAKYLPVRTLSTVAQNLGIASTVTRVIGNGAAVKAKKINADHRADAVAHHTKACFYDGCTSFAGIAKCLNSKGLTTARGSVFQPMTVSRVMARLQLSFSTN